MHTQLDVAYWSSPTQQACSHGMLPVSPGMTAISGWEELDMWSCSLRLICIWPGIPCGPYMTI